MNPALVAFLALQIIRAGVPNSARTSSEANILNVPGVSDHFKDGVTVFGKLVFPSDVVPTYLDVDLEDLYGSVVRSTKSGPKNEFRFERVLIPNLLQTYYIVIQAEGFDIVRQQLQITSNNFSGAFVTIQLRHAPGRASADLEDVVSVANLRQPPPKDAQKLFDKAMEELRKSELQKGVADLEKAVKQAPDFYEANLQLGLQYQRQDRREDAMRLLAHAIKINPGSMKARAGLGQLYHDAGRFEESAELLNQAVRLGSSSADVYFALGSSYLKLEDLDRAEESIRRAKVIAGGNMRTTYLLLHNVYIKRKMLDKALGELEAYLVKFPNADDRETVQSAADKLRRAVKP